MTHHRTQSPLTRRALVAALPLVAATGGAHAQAGGVELSVTQWGVAIYGLPFAVAMDQGLFRQAGIDVTGIIGSGGGGTTVRNTLAGAFPYGEVAVAAAVAAKRSGLDIVAVNIGVHTAADCSVVVPQDSQLQSIADLAGKKVSITSPRSVSEMLLLMALKEKQIDAATVTRVVAGGYGQGLTLLDHGAVVAAVMTEPLAITVRDRYRTLVAYRDVLPPLVTSLGIADRAFAAANADRIRAVIAGRRAAVRSIYANPADAATAFAKTCNVPLPIAQESCSNMVAAKMWSEGAFDKTELDRIAGGLRLIGEVSGAVDWASIVDQSYLPDDLRSTL